jgi:hypothetical protein
MHVWACYYYSRPIMMPNAEGVGGGVMNSPEQSPVERFSLIFPLTHRKASFVLLPCCTEGFLCAFTLLQFYYVYLNFETLYKSTKNHQKG